MKSQRKILAISRLATSSTNKSSILNNRFSLNAFAYLVAKNANLQYLKFAKHSDNFNAPTNFDQNDQTKRLMDLTLYIYIKTIEFNKIAFIDLHSNQS
jgi:hypothetical protein